MYRITHWENQEKPPEIPVTRAQKRAMKRGYWALTVAGPGSILGGVALYHALLTFIPVFAGIGIGGAIIGWAIYFGPTAPWLKKSQQEYFVVYFNEKIVGTYIVFLNHKKKWMTFHRAIVKEDHTNKGLLRGMRLAGALWAQQEKKYADYKYVGFLSVVKHRATKKMQKEIKKALKEKGFKPIGLFKTQRTITVGSGEFDVMITHLKEKLKGKEILIDLQENSWKASDTQSHGISEL